MAVELAGRRGACEGSGELPIAPMVDVVFLLLIYFMVSASIEKQEADIGFSLPAVVESEEQLAFPDFQVVEIDAEGVAWINGYAYGSVESGAKGELVRTLARFREGGEMGGVAARVVIAPADVASHESVVRVMDACAAAGIEGVSFAR